jgi:hypothetical protein
MALSAMARSNEFLARFYRLVRHMIERTLPFRIRDEQSRDVVASAVTSNWLAPELTRWAV